MTIVSTNNRYLQHVDHKFLTYTYMKMANHSILVIQFDADGDALFSNQTITMSFFTPSLKHFYSEEKLESISESLMSDGLQHGWILPKLSPLECFVYFAEVSEPERCDPGANIKSKPAEPFFKDKATSVNHHILLRCATDVFSSSSPIIGGLPRCATQGEYHWLRKVIKSSLLSCKPLVIGNYLILFSFIAKVYELRPDFRLVRKDININNKTDQRSLERLVSQNFLKGRLVERYFVLPQSRQMWLWSLVEFFPRIKCKESSKHTTPLKSSNFGELWLPFWFVHHPCISLWPTNLIFRRKLSFPGNGLNSHWRITSAECVSCLGMTTNFQRWNEYSHWAKRL